MISSCVGEGGNGNKERWILAREKKESVLTLCETAPEREDPHAGVAENERLFPPIEIRRASEENQETALKEYRKYDIRAIEGKARTELRANAETSHCSFDS